MSIKRNLWRLLDYLMVSLIIYGAILFFGAGIIENAPSHIELPLGGLDSLAVDSEENVYCSSGAYNRIQVYDSKGKFLRGLHIQMKAPRLYIDSENNLHVWSSYKEYRKYNPKGEHLIEESDTEFSAPPGGKYRFVESVQDNQGNIYRIPWYSALLSRVLKTTPSGETRVLISQPFYLWFIKMPLPAFLFGLIGILYLGSVPFLRTGNPKYLPGMRNREKPDGHDQIVTK